MPVKRPTVLIVDDDPSIRKMLTEVLTLEGFPTETATDGGEAVETMTKAGPRVVLLDLLMPVGGREVMRQLEAQPEIRGKHQIILVSAVHNLEAARDLQVDGRLPKPFTVDQLLNALDAVAARS